MQKEILSLSFEGFIKYQEQKTNKQKNIKAVLRLKEYIFPILLYNLPIYYYL